MLHVESAKFFLLSKKEYIQTQRNILSKVTILRKMSLSKNLKLELFVMHFFEVSFIIIKRASTLFISNNQKY